MKPMKYIDEHIDENAIKTISTEGDLRQCYGYRIPYSYLYSEFCWYLIPYTFYGGSLLGDDDVPVNPLFPSVIKGKPKRLHLEEEVMSNSFSDTTTYSFMDVEYPQIEYDKNGLVKKCVLSRPAVGSFHVIITVETELPKNGESVFISFPHDLTKIDSE